MRSLARHLLLIALALPWRHPARAGQVTAPLAEHRAIELEFDDQAQVLHYRQIHNIPEPSRAVRRRIHLSQYALARFLWAHPEYVVFDELPEGHREDLPASFVAGRFPGLVLPEAFERLTRGQRRMLRMEGGAAVVQAMGRIPAIHPCFTSAEDKAIWARIQSRMRSHGTIRDPAGRALIGTEREVLAAGKVKAFLKANPARKVLLVFGASHEFRQHFEGIRFGEFTGMELIVGLRAVRGASGEVRTGPGLETKGETKASVAGPTSEGVDTPEADHRTPLVHAILAQRPERVRALLAAGADARRRDAHGLRPLDYAALGNDVPILELVLDRLALADVEAPVVLPATDPGGADGTGQGPQVRQFENVLALVEDCWERDGGEDFSEVIRVLEEFLEIEAARLQGEAKR